MMGTIYLNIIKNLPVIVIIQLVLSLFNYNRKRSKYVVEFW